MSMDQLQEKIRKRKNPSMVSFTVLPEQIPPHLREETGSPAAAYGRFCRELIEGLRGIIPAVRLSFGSFAILGPEGLRELTETLKCGARAGCYVLLDAPEFLSPYAAANGAAAMFGEDSLWPCDGLVLSSYLGSDILRPFLNARGGRDVFVVVRTPNKSAPELQDLLTGSRLVHGAAASMVNRFGEGTIGKWGYSAVGALTAATSQDSIKYLREKYPHIFFLMDGYDYSGGNARNCSFAFDQFGHGAIACAGATLAAAWVQAGTDGRDYVEQAVRAAERMQRNMTRYTAIL